MKSVFTIGGGFEISLKVNGRREREKKESLFKLDSRAALK
jgi:hypothetical protein